MSWSSRSVVVRTAVDAAVPLSSKPAPELRPPRVLSPSQVTNGSTCVVSGGASGRYEELRLLVNSCIRDLDRKGMRGKRKPCGARPQEEGRHAVSKMRRAVSNEKRGKRWQEMHRYGGEKETKDSQLEKRKR
ncbi:hypothetical protein E2C01_027099 [Portunus trituberculatus]|uniref:Uncharacterized protein n=1 Tax=Portunus trituberculatus TaxID=210409 RepID=A0A5B7EH14_PORTR|nr:hypothetical protein [Portunus trituberculatus]